MDLLITLIVSFLLLVVSTLKGYFIFYPLLASLLLWFAVLVRRGFLLKDLIQMAIAGAKKSFPVFIILLLIGAVTSSWMSAGTVPSLVYYGIQIINPHYFILLAFLLTSLVSLLIGTSFGTVGTIGIALMIMAGNSGGNSNLVAGAILSGAYFGDRCSPMSSSANLIASVTQTRLYTNIKNMLKTGFIPLILTVIIYLILSRLYPIQITDRILVSEIVKTFNPQPLLLLPAFTIFILAIFQVEVKLSMIVSIAIASLIALFYQQYSPIELLNFIFRGFYLSEPSPLQSILIGGGMIAMGKVVLIVIVSTALAGILADTHILNFIEQFLHSAKSQQDLFLATMLIGTVSGAYGCTQTIAILLTQQLVKKRYQTLELKDEQLAVNLENTVVMISPLIPWNIAGLVPVTLLMSDFNCLPYAFYLYLIPLFNLLRKPKDVRRE
ncbi:Na+/H+ antiporter NhaC family protein [Capilliphycus salinus ALCB114379]|uniref:Na+/H+ antiporter NhaC family protein n=1 Tax=Capilliphycus salinus TaxID=2768948 RepID=UPI0039A57103